MTWLAWSALTGWLATMMVVVAAVAGVIIRHLRKTPPLVRRMRPHYIAGYAALVLAPLHGFFAMGAMQGANGAGLRAATVAIFALGVQTFVGASLQDPGSYRHLLRGWHIAVFAALIFSIGFHVTSNAAFVP